MAYNLEEQEQIAALKAWWKQYGSLVTYAALAAALTLAAYQGWRYYRGTQNVAARTLYEQLERAQGGGEHKKVIDIAGQITARYGATSYAVLAALASARSAFISGDLASAATQLKWAVDNARDDESRDLARLRLAGVMLDQKRLPEAMATLEATPAESMSGLYAEMKGDILVAQGRSGEARAAYQLALDKSESGSTYRAMVQLKLDGLGTPVPDVK